MILFKKKLEKGKKKLLSTKEIELLEEKLEQLNQGKDAQVEGEENIKFFSKLGLLSIKPKIIVCNVDEDSLKIGNKFTDNVKTEYSNEKIVIICADIEDQIWD